MGASLLHMLLQVPAKGNRYHKTSRKQPTPEDFGTRLCWFSAG